MLFKRLHDQDAIIREMASLILKTRGLSQEQIGLGGLIYSPKPEQRVSVIPLLEEPDRRRPGDLAHPALARPGRDGANHVDRGARASTSRRSVQRRLAEMARTDKSEAVRQAAGKAVRPLRETTAALPPLPGSSSLNPKAN